VSTTHGLWATPALADLDLDGRLEVVVLALDGRLYAWHADGSEVRDGDANPATQGVLFQIPGSANWSRGGPSVANVLPADPTPEIVFGTENGKVYVLRADGTVATGWPRTVGSMVDASPSLGDIDHDGGLEIAVPCRDGQLYVFRGDGTNQPGWPRPVQNRWAALTPSVALADFDADGKLELVVASTGSTVSEGNLYVYDWQGNVRPGWPVDVHMASESSPVVGDLDGNGSMEIVYGGESGDLFAFTAAGGMFPGFPIKVGAEVRATPMLTDADGDGRVDMLVSGWDQQVYMWKFPGFYVRHRVPWGTLKGNPRRNGVFDYRDATDVPETPAVPSGRTALYPNVPNPFNPTTTIRFDLGGTAAQHVSLRIFDVRGALVRTLLDRPAPPGRYDVRWDGHDTAGRAVASGVYFYRLDAADLRAQRKMVLVR
jgi:outer membrane protein assembly factor BamB